MNLSLGKYRGRLLYKYKKGVCFIKNIIKINIFKNLEVFKVVLKVYIRDGIYFV